MKVCLVLEGGALRGIYTAGVLDELMKENIKIDAIILYVCAIVYVSIGKLYFFGVK